MKKQILFLVFFLLAAFAGMNRSFGQTYINYVEGAPACTPAVPLACASAATADALHPNPGTSYLYSVTTTPGTVDAIHWFVTTETNVIAAATLTGTRDGNPGTYVQTADGHYDNPASTNTSINITWNNFDGSTTTVLLVAYVQGADGCSDNIEVYKIEPIFNFTLDVAGILDDGTLGAEECVSPVESAIYNAGTNQLDMDYGENWVFFSVNAANFVHSWEPTFSATTTSGTIGTVQWAYPADAQADVNWNNSGTPVMEQNGSGEVGSTGECIVVRVQVDHGNTEAPEGAATTTVTLSIDGVMYNGTDYSDGNLADLDEGNPDCVNNVTDTADYTLLPRPQIDDATGVAPGFVIKN